MITSLIASVIGRSGNYPTALEGTIHFCGLIKMCKGKRNGSLRRTATRLERFPISRAPRQRKAESAPLVFKFGLSATHLDGFKVTATDFAELSQWILGSVYAFRAYFFG